MQSASPDNLAAPCGLYCGSCIDYLMHKSCHGCNCQCGACSASEHHRQCNVFNCCAEQKNVEACSACAEFPCATLIQFCYHPVWVHHLPVVENLRRRLIGTERWLKEQEQIWSNKWYLRRWLWLQMACEDKLKQAQNDINRIFGDSK